MFINVFVYSLWSGWPSTKNSPHALVTSLPLSDLEWLNRFQYWSFWHKTQVQVILQLPNPASVRPLLAMPMMGFGFVVAGVLRGVLSDIWPWTKGEALEMRAPGPSARWGSNCCWQPKNIPYMVVCLIMYRSLDDPIEKVDRLNTLIPLFSAVWIMLSWMQP